MIFDKIKAMRSAERYLSQGKIRAAIGEYKTIVDNDPKDFNTLNMLGDLYCKNKETSEAVNCFTRVAEHYVKQGFAQKAIAIYNKISRLQPDSLDISARLAELYQAKGSFAEARSHYVTLADQYQRGGKKLEALTVWKQIAELDPHNAEVYLKIAENYWQEKQKDEAAEAFTIAGTRFTAQGKHESALTAFSRALEIRHHDFNALNGFVKSQISLGYADEAAKTLENILEQQPYNREILFLLADCHLDTNNPAEAERAVVKLVEQEPANYPKFLELVESYIKNGDSDSAARILSVSSEHLLVGGQSEDFLKWTNEILARNPEHLAALRLLVRYYGWNRDEDELKSALERLAESAALANSPEDEKSALSQLVVLAPNEARYAERLQDLGSYTNEPPPVIEFSENPEFEKFTGTVEKIQDDESESFDADSFGEFRRDFEVAAEFAEELQAHDLMPEESHDFEDEPAGKTTSGRKKSAKKSDAKSAGNKNQSPKLSAAAQLQIEKELDSIRFYIEQGYTELAEKSLQDLQDEFGEIEEVTELRQQISRGLTGEAFEDSIETFDAETYSADENSTAPPDFEFVSAETDFDFQNPEITTDAFVAFESEPADAPQITEPKIETFNFLDDFRSEFDIEETAAKPDGDYDTHFQMAIAYSEMGLSEEAIREFQDAINQVAPDDGTRRFFQCAHLLGNCFMEKRMPHLALLWYQRALETENLNAEEKQGIWYELGGAYQAGGEPEKALETFEKIYAVDVDYRDVKTRVQSLLVNS